MKKSKRHVTLIEVVIAMSLTLIVLSTLTYFYQEMATLDAMGERQQQKNFQMLYVGNRLMTSIPKTIDNRKSDFVFFTPRDVDPLLMPGSPSLIFTFDNGVKLDPLFANNVLGRLYLDNKGRLTLAKWPSPTRWKTGNPPMKKEVLMEGVKEMEFAFFSSPDRGKRENNYQKASPIAPPTPQGEWAFSEWSKDYQQLPLMMKITLTMEEDDTEYVFAFPLPNAKEPVIYEG